MSNNNGPARLLLNEGEKRNHWLTVKLEGVKDNRDGLGALVAVQRRGRAPLWRQARADGSYLSASDRRIHFGLGAAKSIESIVVQWPSGARESWTIKQADRQITLRQHTGKAVSVSKKEKL